MLDVHPPMTPEKLEAHFYEQITRHSPLVSISERVSSIDPLVFLHYGRRVSNTSVFWERTDEPMALVGIGSALTLRPDSADRFGTIVRSWAALVRGWRAATAPRLADGPWPMMMGGFSFDPRQPHTSPVWDAFGESCMVLPAVQLTCQGDQTFLTYNLVLTNQEEQRSAAYIEQLIEHIHRLRALVFNLSPVRQHGLARQPQIREAMPASEWQAIVASATDAIQQGAFQKTVLAREVVLHFDQPVAIEATLERLRNAFPSTTRFAITHGTSCLLGASPERLVQLHNNQVVTAALAGSAPRGSTPEQDQQLGDALLGSAKDRGEHAAVVTMIREKLEPLCDHFQADEQPQLLKLANVQHLYTPIQGYLRQPATVLSLVEQLHPTPALGGYPVEQALAFIRDHEQLDRGWYAAPIGWMNADGDGDFCAAIRSALVQQDTVRLYGGCGIVAASDPATEYQESEWKLQVMINNMLVQRVETNQGRHES